MVPRAGDLCVQSASTRVDAQLFFLQGTVLLSYVPRRGGREERRYLRTHGDLLTSESSGLEKEEQEDVTHVPDDYPPDPEWFQREADVLDRLRNIEYSAHRQRWGKSKKNKRSWRDDYSPFDTIEGQAKALGPRHIQYHGSLLLLGQHLRRKGLKYRFIGCGGLQVDMIDATFCWWTSGKCGVQNAIGRPWIPLPRGEPDLRFLDALKLDLEKKKEKSMDPERFEPVSFENCTVDRETEKAFLVIVHGDQKAWIPKSQIHEDSEIYANDEEDWSHEGTLVIPRWIAEDKGLV